MKIIFLDLDGTLNESFTPAPESALEAIRRARVAGNKVFINTGRAVGEVPVFVKAIEMDGMVTSQGAYIEADGKVLFDKPLPSEHVKEVYDLLETNHIPHVLETQHEIVGSRENLDYAKEFFISIQESHGVKRDVPNELVGIMRESDDLSKEAQARKILYYDSNITLKEMEEMFGNYFTITASSINNQKSENGEIGDIEVSKARGMEIVAKYYGCTIEDTVAVGDGANDMTMIKAAGLGIAMGNGDEAIKEIADYIADKVTNDGLYKAFEENGLF